MKGRVELGKAVVTQDPVTGELIKPATWSDARFTLFKILRIKAILAEAVNGVPRDPKLFPEELFEEPFAANQTRHKRSAVDKTKILKTVVPSIVTGIFRQDKVGLPEVKPLGNPGSKSELKQLTRIAHLSGDKVLAFTTVPDEGTIKLYSVSTQGVFTEITDENGNGIKVDVDECKKSANSGFCKSAVVTDIAVLDRGSNTFYICATVNLQINRKEADDFLKEGNENYKKANDINDPSNELNDPSKVPSYGRSRIFKVVLNSGSTYKAMELSGVLGDTAEANAATTWKIGSQQYLAIAQKDYINVDTTRTTSLVYRVFDNDIITPLQNDLYTNNAVAVKYMRCHNQHFLIFANENDPIDNNLAANSRVFRLSPATGKFELWQDLITFGAVGVETLKIKDKGNPFNDHFFVIFANKAEETPGSKSDVESMVYKFKAGKFIPYQQLDVTKPVAVKVVEKYHDEAPEKLLGVNYRSEYLDQAVVFNQADEAIRIFQFSGNSFREVLPKPTATGTNLQIASFEAHGSKKMMVYKNAATQIYGLEFETKASNKLVNQLYGRQEKLTKFCHGQTTLRHDEEERDTIYLEQVYKEAPKKSDASITLDHLKIAGTINVGDVELDSKKPAAKYPELSVSNMQTINKAYFDETHQLLGEPDVTPTLTFNLPAQKTALQTLKNVVTKGHQDFNAVLKNEAVNDLKDDLNVKDLTVDSDLSTQSLTLDTIEGNDGNGEASTVVFDNFLGQMVYIKDAGASGKHGIITDVAMTLEHVVLSKEFTFNKLNSRALTDYVHTDSRDHIGGKKTFKTDAIFEKDLTASGTVGGKTLTNSKLLLRNGDQKFSDQYTASGTPEFATLTTSEINKVNMANYMTEAFQAIGKNLQLPSKLTVDTLEVEGGVTSNNKGTGVDLVELLTKTLRTDKANSVSAPHEYADGLTIEGDSSVNVASLNERTWPEDFLYIGDVGSPPLKVNVAGSTEPIEVQTLEKLEECDLKIDGEQTLKADVLVKKSVTTNNKGENVVIDVDNDGNFDLLYNTESPTGVTNYKHDVEGTKTFNVIRLGANSEVAGTVLGFDLKDLEKKEMFTKKRDFTPPKQVEDLRLTGVVTIDELVLKADVLDQKYNSDQNEYAKSNFKTLLDNGVERMATEITTPNSIDFSNAVFEEDLAVTTLDGFKPEKDYLTKAGSDTFKFEHPMEFKDDTRFKKDIVQTDPPNAKIEACKLSTSRAHCLCLTDAQSECTDPNCESVSGECVIKTGMESPSLYAKLISNNLPYIKANALHKTRDQNMVKFNGDDKPDTPTKAVFDKGLEATELDVTGTGSGTCELNGVDCQNIAVTNVEETYTGRNEIFGELKAKAGIKIIDTLQVDGKVAGVDVDEDIYGDSLVLNKDTMQTVSGSTTISKEFVFTDFTTNTVNIGSTDIEKEMKALDNEALLNNAGLTHNIETDVAFKALVNTPTIEATGTFDNVPVTTFLNNLWLNGEEQTFTGAINVDEDVVVNEKLEDLNQEGKINKVDIQLLDKIAYRRVPAGSNSPAPSLGNVNLQNIVSIQDEKGIIVNGKFLGRDISVEAVLKKGNHEVQDNGKVIISGQKTYGISDGASKLTIDTDLILTGNVREVNGNGLINVDELWNFVANDHTVTKVSITNSVDATNEPEITNVAESDRTTNLNDLRINNWYKNDEARISFNVRFKDVDFKAELQMKSPVIDTVDLTDWKDHYMSVKNTQDISGQYTYEQGMKMDGNLEVKKIKLEKDGTEGQIITSGNSGVSYKFKADFYDLVLQKDEDYTAIVPKISFNNIDAKKNLMVAESKTLNDRDLSEQFLTYKAKDEKEITHKVNLKGNLKVVPGTVKADVEFLNNDIFLENKRAVADFAINGLTAVNAGDQSKIGFGLDKLKQNYVQKDIQTTQEVEGAKAFSADQTFDNLKLEKLINTKDLGTYTDPKVMIKGNPKGGKFQDLANKVTITDHDVTMASGVTLTTVNQENFDDVIAKGVSRVDNTAIAGKKTFAKAFVFHETTGEPTIDGEVFGINLKTIVEDSRVPVNLQYGSGKTPPDLIDAMQDIREISGNDLVQDFQFYRSIHPSIHEDRPNIDADYGIDRAMPLYDKHGQTYNPSLPGQFQVASLYEHKASLQAANIAFYSLPMDQKPTLLTFHSTNRLEPTNTHKDKVKPTDRLQKIGTIFHKSTQQTIYIALTNSLDKGDLTSHGIETDYKLEIRKTLKKESFDVAIPNEPAEGPIIYALAYNVESKKMVLRQYRHSSQTMDIETILVGKNQCVVFCNSYPAGKNGPGLEVHCVRDTRDGPDGRAAGSFYKYETVADEVKDVEQCYVAAATSLVMPPDNDGDTFAIGEFKDDMRGKVKIFKTSNDPNLKDDQGLRIRDKVVLTQQFYCPYCSNVELGRFVDPLTGTLRTFLVTVAQITQNVYIREYDTKSKKFKVFQKLKLIEPVSARFINPGHFLKLVLLSGTGVKAQINSFVFRGAQKFVVEGVEQLDAPGVENMEAFVNIYTQDQYITTSGVVLNEFSRPNNIYEVVYKYQDFDRVRQEVMNSSTTTMPKVIRPKCHNMVANYLTHMYDQKSLVEGEIADTVDVANLMMETLPKYLIGYSPLYLSTQVKDYMKTDKFAQLRQQRTAAAVANMYKYEGSTRPINDDTYMGSLYIYQDVKTTLYITGTLMMGTPLQGSKYRHVSFAENCEPGADEIPALTYSTPGQSNPYDETEASNPDKITRHMCAMFHGLPEATVIKLEDLVGTANAGAIIVYEGELSTSRKLGCGFMKNPGRARIQYLKDHNSNVHPFNPFLPSQPSSPIATVRIINNGVPDVALGTFNLLTDKYVEGRPVFKSDNYYIYYNKDDSTWYVGEAFNTKTMTEDHTTAGKTGRLMRSKSTTTSPPNTWEVYTNGVWQRDNGYGVRFG